jgi:hypothetical protein
MLLNFADPEPDHNGSTIISYELQMDDGFSGDYVSLIGYSTNSLLKTFLITDGLIKGRHHRFKYRAKNNVGWGPFSDPVSIIAANVPQPPERPYFSSYENDQLSIMIPQSADNGGSSILYYELWVDSGDDFQSAYTKINNYAGLVSSY